MTLDLRTPLPLLTADVPGIGGRIKAEPEDFEVEEIPAYEPCGQGEHLYLWIEKRDMGAEYFARQIARRLGLRPDEVGMAGLKDRRAVTRQWVSVAAHVEPRLGDLAGEGIQLLKTSRHGNKLRPGHLRGNRFRIRIRDVDLPATVHLNDTLARIRAKGLPNFYGSQRFGRDGETLDLGLRLLHIPSRPSPDSGEGRVGVGRFLRKLALSAVQAALFNQCLSQRMLDGLLQQVLPGDVMAKWPAGGMFVATDVPAEQARFDRRETLHTGPIFGRKMFQPAAQALARETAVLSAAGLTPNSFASFGKLLQGTRRHNLVYADDLQGTVEESNVILTFTLPAGSYATILLREVMKREESEESTEEDEQR